jgi:hypothetical protein
MLNLTPNSTNNLIVYADTVSAGYSAGNDFTISFTNLYSKQVWNVLPSIIRRNSRFIEFEIDLVGVTGFNDPVNGSIYLYPEGNYDYEVFNTSAATIGVTGPLQTYTWINPGEFEFYVDTTWASQGITYKSIDLGQAYLYSEVPCLREIEFVPYEGGNNWLDNIVYVTGIPLYQFPCTIPTPEQFVLEQTTTTYCPVITIEGGASLTIPGQLILTQITGPYGQC